MSPLSRISHYEPSQTVAISPYSPAPTRTESLYENCIASIGGIIRDTFFMPLFNKLPPEWLLQLKKEKEFFYDFWDPKSDLRPEFPRHKDIRNHFTYRTDKIAVTVLEKKLWVNCLVIESKKTDSSDEFYNFIQVVGNSSTIDSNIAQTYPFLASYLDRKDAPPARFILISQYNIESEEKLMPVYKIKTLQEGGFILSETLKSLEKTYGTLHQIFAHSLGCMIAAASLQYFHEIAPLRVQENNIFHPLLQKIYKLFVEITVFFNRCYEYSIYSLTGRVTKIVHKNPSILKATQAFRSFPKNIHFDRGPSCIEELSKDKWGGPRLMWLAKLSGWDMDFGKEIFDFLQDTKEPTPSITLSSALQDHVFNGKASLSENPYILRLITEKKITSLLLDITQQCAHSNAHHSLSAGLLHRLHLIKKPLEENFFQENESLSDAIIRRSLPPFSKVHFTEIFMD